MRVSCNMEGQTSTKGAGRDDARRRDQGLRIGTSHMDVKSKKRPPVGTGPWGASLDKMQMGGAA